MRSKRLAEAVVVVAAGNQPDRGVLKEVVETWLAPELARQIARDHLAAAQTMTANIPEGVQSSE
jgi:hypothetical protein